MFRNRALPNIQWGCCHLSVTNTVDWMFLKKNSFSSRGFIFLKTTVKWCYGTILLLILADVGLHPYYSSELLKVRGGDASFLLSYHLRLFELLRIMCVCSVQDIETFGFFCSIAHDRKSFKLNQDATEDIIYTYFCNLKQKSRVFTR